MGNGNSDPRVVKVFTFLVDIILVYLSFQLSRILGFAYYLEPGELRMFFIIFSLAWVVSGFLNDLYPINDFHSLRRIAVNLAHTFFLHVFLILLIIVGQKSDYPRLFLATVYCFSAASILGSRIMGKLLIRYYHASSDDLRRVIIVGNGASGQALRTFFDKHEQEGYRFMGFFGSNGQDTGEYPVAGDIDKLKIFCKSHEIEEIYFAKPLSCENKPLIQELTDFSDNNFIHFRLAPDFSEVVNSYNLQVFDSIPVLTTRKEPLDATFNAMIKRAFDIVFSLMVVFFIYPILIPIVTMAIKIESPGPVLFRQLRPGKKNKLFTCYKFRTMHVNNCTESQATKNDPRITRVGRVLRKTNLDEFPQFINVLLGDMSVVGPRPNMVSQLEYYSKTINKYKMRHFVTPGITGYAQVNGYRGETKDPNLMMKRVEYDVEYMENWSLLLDIKIILLTVWNMIHGEKNAY